MVPKTRIRLVSMALGILITPSPLRPVARPKFGNPPEVRFLEIINSWLSDGQRGTFGMQHSIWPAQTVRFVLRASRVKTIISSESPLATPVPRGVDNRRHRSSPFLRRSVRGTFVPGDSMVVRGTRRGVAVTPMEFEYVSTHSHVTSPIGIPATQLSDLGRSESSDPVKRATQALIPSRPRVRFLAKKSMRPSVSSMTEIAWNRDSILSWQR